LETDGVDIAAAIELGKYFSVDAADALGCGLFPPKCLSNGAMNPWGPTW
jgi:hypothetical protein